MPTSPEDLEPSIRLAGTADCLQLLEIHRQAILVSARSAYTEEECASWAANLVHEKYREAMMTGGETFLVAEHARTLNGFCSFKTNEICALYVAPEFGGKGVGTRLLSCAEDAIISAGHTKIQVDAALSALCFYQKRGYSVIRRRLAPTRGGLLISACDLEKQIKVRKDPDASTTRQ